MTHLVVPHPNGGDIANQTPVGWRRNLWLPGSFDYDIFEDKFWGDALDVKYPPAKVATGTVTFTEHNLNGFIELKSGASTGNYAGQGLGLQFSGDRGVLAEFILKMPASLAGLKFEVGLTDADDDAGAINVKSTPSLTATDCAVFVFDTDHNTQLDFIAAKGGSVVEATTNVLTIATSDTLRFVVRVDGDNVNAWLNDKLVAQTSLGIEGGNGLTPWVFVQARSNNERIVELHKWRVTQPAF